jgi:hypothetical protein
MARTTSNIPVFGCQVLIKIGAIHKTIKRMVSDGFAPEQNRNSKIYNFCFSTNISTDVTKKLTYFYAVFGD